MRIVIVCVKKNRIMVGIVVVTYNRLSLLKECIDALRHQTYKIFVLLL